jgi:hypothetical protein
LLFLLLVIFALLLFNIMAQIVVLVQPKNTLLHSVVSVRVVANLGDVFIVRVILTFFLFLVFPVFMVFFTT